MEFEREAAGTVKRVLRPPATEPDWTADPGLARMTPFLETKTVWHPIGGLEPDRPAGLATAWDGARSRGGPGRMCPVARPSIVPIALTLDDRTGYTLWAPPWEEDGEEWQAFLGTTEDDADDRATRVHLFPTPAALAAFCRTSTDHDLADHPVWPVVAGLGAADLTPDDDHRFDLDGVYDIAAENPDRWAVEELAATIDIVSRLAECLDTSGERGRRATTTRTRASSRPSPSSPPSPRSAPSASASRPSSAAPARTPGSASAAPSTTSGRTSSRSSPSTWTGPAPARRRSRTTRRRRRSRRSTPTTLAGRRRARGRRRAAAPPSPSRRPGAHHRPRRPDHRRPRPRSPRPARFWESVGILPVEVVVPEGAGVTLRCYVEDVARFLGRDGEVFLFDTPADLARFCKGTEEHDLIEIASWPEVADTDVPPLPADQDRYDLTELSEVLAEVADGAAGLVDHRAFAQPVEGVRDLAEYAGLARVEELLSPTSPLGREVARAEREPDADAARRGRRRAAPAVGRGRHPDQRSAGLPRLSGTASAEPRDDERPAPGDPGTGRSCVQC